MAPAMHLVLFRLQQQLRCPFLAPNVSIATRFSPSIQRPNLCSQFVAGVKHASWRRRSLGAAAAAVVAHQQTPAAVVERHHHSATPAAAVFTNGFQTGIGELEFGKVLRVADDESCCTLNKPETEEEEKKDGLSLPADSATMENWKLNDRLFECCERGKLLKVAVLVSGGVDSSVALRLLCEAGHNCTAFYLKIWFQEDFENFWSECPWEEDLEYAQAVCNEVRVELQVVHLTDEYWKLVVSHSISEIQAGQTPNPDILCNSHIKFGAFLQNVEDAQFDRIASGHYARVEHAAINGDFVGARLLLSADQVKDQTYFLSHLTQAQLSRLMFPIGGLTKVEVRELAEAMGLSNKHRKDSQGICFLGKVKFNEFIAKHLGEREGRLIEAETGELLGLHKGFWFYTIGQRHGLYLSNGPWFVVAKDVENNVVFISRKYYSEEKQRRAFRVASFSWFSGYAPTNLARLQCKVRHGPRSYNCNLEFESPECSGVDVLVPNNVCTAIVTLSEDDQGLAPGQYTAFYQKEVCLGSAVITEALGGSDHASVSEQALQVSQQPFDIEVYKSSKPKLSSSLRGNESNNRVKQSCASS
ncbi:unnamed protein product [Sphagnum jensenii]|uniref:tRNA-5-taurinomethyluridine 2-sulfurtransferase n=1 Tax=Sphagnum jensenii TaxID=128206 RepID=A0ABP0WST9_9BRYO